MSFFFVCNYLCFIAAGWSRIPIVVYIVWIEAVFAITAFLFSPLNTTTATDLARIFYELDLYRAGLGDNLYIEAPLSSLYLHLVAYMFSNNHFLPVISVIVSYTLCFLTLLKILKYFSIDNKSVKRFAISILICGVAFFGIMNNIRYSMAMMFYWWIFYYDVIKHFKYAKLLYILAILLHPGTSMMVIVRVISAMKTKYMFMIMSMIGAFFYFLQDEFFSFLVDLFPVDSVLRDMALGISVKALSYSISVMYDIPWTMKLADAYLLFCLIICFILGKNYHILLLKNKIIENVITCMIILCLFGFTTNFMSGDFTGRIIVYSSVLNPLLMSDILTKCKNNCQQHYIYMKIFCLLLMLPYVSMYLFYFYDKWLYSGL